MYEKLKDVKFYSECKSFRNTNELNGTWELVTLPAIEKMVKALKDINKFKPQRNINMLQTACPSCPYNQLCMEELRGNDTAAIREDFTYNSYLDKYEDL
jgi:hypothetical protein